ncbi:MAG: extradiol dioxygenase [Acidobacteria bacterium]|nr:extradiol dioxygenase [Acidobacteriota bacterium]
MNRRCLFFLFAAPLLLTIAAPAQSTRDPLAPKTSGENALTRQLHTITICTRDLDRSLRFYRDALGLRASGPLPQPSETRRTQRALWGIPEGIDWQLYLFDRPGVPEAIRIRLLVLDRETPAVHRSWNPKEPGGLSLGFPTLDLHRWDREIRKLGFGSMNPLSEYQVPREDGTLYGIHETVFNGPDFVHAVGISRRDGMAQVGPVDPASGRGGPSYSAQVVEKSDQVLDFYVSLLGLELRSDREWRSQGSKGALGLPDGTAFRFSIVYAPGAAGGHLLFLDFREPASLSTGVPPRPPNRGLVMWSFPVRDVAAVEKQARRKGIEVVSGPVSCESPEMGPHRALTLLAPNGFLVELFDGGQGKPYAPPVP